VPPPALAIDEFLELRVVQEDGSVSVRITYDHRVLDGATAARTLMSLEDVLNGEILAELRQEEQASAA
jgi:pyruvate/2-oxoglutarate dehydrogenase complex dihydrolipoamide acyltransferase (E2) component